MTSYKNTFPNIPAIEGVPFSNRLPFSQIDRLQLLNTVARNCGDIGFYHFGPFKVVHLNSAELYQQALVDSNYTFSKGAAQRMAFDPVIGNSIFSSDGKFHYRQRKMLAPSFTHSQISQFADVIVNYSQNLLEKWADGTTVDLVAEMLELTMHISGKIFFSLDNFDDTTQIAKALALAVERAENFGSSYFPIPLTWPTPYNRRVKEGINFYRGKVLALINARRYAPNPKRDFLSTLLAARDENGQPMSDKQLLDEAVTIFLAGYDNPSFALPWSFYILSQHPAIYRKLQQEIDNVLEGRAPTLADVPRLSYTSQVFKEVLRLYPPVYNMVRTTAQAVEIGGYHLPKGQIVTLSPYTLHRRHDYYPDPTRFDPDRFSVAAEKSRERYTYMPFGAGPHVCIGNHFAMLEGVLVLATISQQFDFELVQGQKIELSPRLVMRSKQPIRMQLKRRRFEVSKEPLVTDAAGSVGFLEQACQVERVNA